MAWTCSCDATWPCGSSFSLDGGLVIVIIGDRMPSSSSTKSSRGGEWRLDWFNGSSPACATRSIGRLELPPAFVLVLALLLVGVMLGPFLSLSLCLCLLLMDEYKRSQQMSSAEVRCNGGKLFEIAVVILEI